MLKIKEGIKLKELLKYGFKSTAFPRLYIKNVYFNKKDMIKLLTYSINTKTREIEISFYYGNCRLDNTLYDMIQDEIIEKVE